MTQYVINNEMSINSNPIKINIQITFNDNQSGDSVDT